MVTSTPAAVTQGGRCGHYRGVNSDGDSSQPQKLVTDVSTSMDTNRFLFHCFLKTLGSCRGALNFWM